MVRQALHLLIVLVVPFLLYLGCASTHYARGHKELEQARYEQALTELRSAVAEDYRNTDAIRDIGIALHHQGKSAMAQKFIRLALNRRPKDFLAQYYLGLTYEAMDQPEKAIESYRAYTEISPFNKLRKVVENRMLVLLQKQMEAQTRAMLQTEQNIQVSAIPDQSVAVLYFVNSSANQELDPLQKGLTEMLITDLAQIKSLTVVERARLQQLMEEMGLGMSGLVREDTAPRVGKLLGAAQVVLGTLTGLENQSVRIDAALANIKTVQRNDAAKVSGSLLEFYQLEKNLAFDVIDAMKITLSREEKDAIQKVPTKNLLAFMAFCRGLDQMDQQNWDVARQEFAAALKQDPGFQMARSELDRSNAFSSFSSPAEMPVVTRGDFSAPVLDRDSAVKTVDDNSLAEQLTAKPPLSLMNRAAAQISSGFIPSVESRKPTTESASTSFGASVPLEVQIRLPIKP
jgi:tetratricopeptide (TPR) repeat protein